MVTSAAALGQELDALFTAWEAERPPHPYPLCRDGVIDPDRFTQARPRVLFVLKEPSNNKVEEFGNDLRKWIVHPEANYSTTWHNLGRWADAFAPRGAREAWQQLEQWPWVPYGSLRHVAVMNLGKFTRRPTADPAIINAYAARDAEFIRREIAIIDPHLIVACGVREPLIWLLDLGDVYLRDGDGRRDDRTRGIEVLSWGGGRSVFLVRHPGRAPGDGLREALREAWAAHAPR